ncbi:MAG: molybdopterin-dependent oxidoreductase [Methanobacteriota archaeon]|nr:MAG: molybdopterin-dependent oxidoreductase [Euryarchaeota archaeon]
MSAESGEHAGDKGSAEPVEDPSKSALAKTGTKKLIALIIIAALLVAVPLGYLALKSGDADGDDNDDGSIALSIVGRTGVEENLTLSEVINMSSIEAVSSYQNRFGNWKGFGTYQGVNLSGLADLVGGMIPGDVMTLTASDGYHQNLSYYQVYADDECLAVQGPSILACEFNGTPCPSWEDGPMAAMLAPDEAFSNDDFNSTCAKDPEFLGSTSAGSLWVKNVERIRIQSMYEEWTVVLTNLEGAQTEVTRTEFVYMQYFDGDDYTDSSERNWSGVPVEVLLGLVDDDDPQTFNDTLAESEYRIVAEATDGYYRAMVAKDLVDKGAIFATQMNGTALPEDFAPVRLVGPDMSGKDMVSMICSIIMDRVAVTVNAGEESEPLTMTELAKRNLSSGTGYYMKSTGTIVGPLDFTGVPVRDLVDLVYDGDNYSLDAVAWPPDTYQMTYSTAQVENGTFPVYDLDGTLLGPQDLTMMLAIERDGARLPYDELRIVVVDDESAPVTDGHFWTKMVMELNVVPYIEGWTLNLSGVTSMDVDRQTFESLASCFYHTTYCNFTDDDGDHSYEGVPLWVLVSAVDGGDAPGGHFMFNDALADAGYMVNVTGADGGSGLFSADQIARNDSIIVAHRLDGKPLEEGDWPLRVVGDALTESQKVKMIASIAIEGFAATPAWNLTLTGLTTAVLTEWDFAALYNCEEGVHISYHNYSLDTVEYSYAGIPLWVLIGMVDGADAGHWAFNDSLAALGYDVKVSALDGCNTTVSIEDIQYNDSLIVALTLNGTYLTGDEYPLKLTGEDLPTSFRIKAVASIELVNIPE